MAPISAAISPPAGSVIQNGRPSFHQDVEAEGADDGDEHEIDDGEIV
jgi:hypothetical protein